jgi:preprotein translocase subunit SecB
VIGLFRKVAEVPKVSLTEFVTLQAVAILLPYLRQFLTSLTINALAGPYYLPTLNVADLMKDFDPAKATGAKQLADEGKVDSQVIAPTDVKTKRHRKRA